MNGLNGPVKLSACLDFLKKHEIQLARIQESHLASQDSHLFANYRHYCTAAVATRNSKSCRVLVVLKYNLSMNITETYASTDGQMAYT